MDENEIIEGQEESQNNAQAEIDAKFKAMQDQMAQINQQTMQSMQAIADAIKPLQQQQRDAGVEVSEPEDFFDLKPGEFKKQILDEVSKVVKDTVSSTSQAQTAAQSKLAELVSDYPELNDTSSDFAQAAVKAHDSLPNNLKDTPEGYEMAALRAAQQLGVKPRSQRKNESDHYSMGGSRKVSNERKDRKRSEESELDPKTLAWAELLGRDTKDPKVVEGLKKANQRKYKNYK